MKPVELLTNFISRQFRYYVLIVVLVVVLVCGGGAGAGGVVVAEIIGMDTECRIC